MYSLESVLNSEMRVFKYIDYQANLTTPYNFIEVLLETLGLNTGLDHIKFLFILSCKILKCFYFDRDNIYNCLFESFTGQAKTKNDR